MATDPKTLKTTAAGLVPCEIMISEAGLGLRKGEVRGLPPKTAAAMIDKEHAQAVDPTFEKPAKGPKAPADDKPPVV